MATPEEYLDGMVEFLQSPPRPDLRLVLGEQAVGPMPTELPRQEYVPYDGANPLIDEEHWDSMDYGQLETVRATISASLGLLLLERSEAEIAQQWDEFSALETEFNIIVTKITWLNGMLRDRRH